MINFFGVFLGLYLVADASFLAAKSKKEVRHCMIAKYVGAFMSGAYLIWLAAKELLLQRGFLDGALLAISADVMQIVLLFGLTIAFFMWPDTFWRGIGYLQIHKPKLHHWLIAHFKIRSRRVNDL